MGRYIEVSNLDNLIERYEAGETVEKLASEIGIGPTTLLVKMRRAGVTHRNWERVSIPTDEIVARYIAGETEQALAAAYGVTRGAIRVRLKKSGVYIRTISDTMRVRWDNATPETAARMLNAAHDAARNRVVPDTERILRAQTRESRVAHASPVEHTLAAALRDAGYFVTQQKAVWKYNVDIALQPPSIAVEVFGGGWHAKGRHLTRFHQRGKYILDAGWHMVIIWVDGLRYPLGVDGVNRVIAFAQEFSRDPAAPRQYRVILGDGQDAPVRENYLNTDADIKRLRGGDD